jgi:hypothetical protein
LQGRYQYYHMFDIDGIQRAVFLNKIDWSILKFNQINQS